MKKIALIFVLLFSSMNVFAQSENELFDMINASLAKYHELFRESKYYYINNERKRNPDYMKGETPICDRKQYVDKTTFPQSFQLSQINQDKGFVLYK